jgi:hypothetical protein
MILALRALGIGDLCAGVPALRALRGAAAAGEELVLAAPRWLEPLVAVTGTADRVLPVGGLADQRLPPVRPRLGVNLHGRGPQSYRLLASSGPAALWAFACPAAGFLDGPQWTPEEHEVARWCRLLEWYGCAADPSDLSLPRTVARAVVLAGGVPPGATVVHPGAKAAQRRWPADRFARTAAELVRRGHRVVVTGSAAEAPLAAAVARGAGLPAGSVLAGALDLGLLAALVAHARLVVCGDTGIGHLATGYRTPSVLLFGPTPPAWWGPPPQRHEHRVLWHGARAGVAAITVDEVLAAAEQVAGTTAAA